MLVKNKTQFFQECGGITVRPWRDAVVPDVTNVDTTIFEIIQDVKKDSKKKVN